jgi:hypothetical protein
MRPKLQNASRIYRSVAFSLTFGLNWSGVMPKALQASRMGRGAPRGVGVAGHLSNWKFLLGGFSMNLKFLRAACAHFGIYAVLAAICVFMPAPAHGEEFLATSAANLRWNSSAKGTKITFLGKDEKENALLVVKKTSVIGTEFSIQSDASAILIVSGDTKVSFLVAPGGGADGAISRVKLVAGDDPNILFNGVAQARNLGKWIEIIKSSEPNMSIQLVDATFATVIFTPKAGETAAPALIPIVADPTPTASKELLKNVTPQQLKAASISFSNAVSHKCPRCNGSGQVTVSKQTGTRRDGNLVRKVYQDFQEQCDKCDGVGEVRANSEALNRFAATFVKTLAATKTDDPKAQDAISDAYKMITERMIGDYKTWVILTENGRSILSQKSPIAGTPVIAKALVKQSLPVKGAKRQYLVEIGGTDKLVLISEPISADEVRSGPALIGGLVEPVGKENADQHPVAVLKYGFLVAPPIEAGWYWWYWWRDRP